MARGAFQTARPWPTSLGDYLGKELVVALDARTGAPRWYERGGQLEEFTLTDGVTCETVHVGFECRDDQSGLHARPVLTIGRGEGSSPPYEGDGTAGISGNLAGIVLSQAPSGAVTIGVFPVRGGGAIAHATVQLGEFHLRRRQVQELHRRSGSNRRGRNPDAAAPRGHRQLSPRRASRQRIVPVVTMPEAPWDRARSRSARRRLATFMGDRSRQRLREIQRLQAVQESLIGHSR